MKYKPSSIFRETAIFIILFVFTSSPKLNGITERTLKRTKKCNSKVYSSGNNRMSDRKVSCIDTPSPNNCTFSQCWFQAIIIWHMTVIRYAISTENQLSLGKHLIKANFQPMSIQRSQISKNKRIRAKLLAYSMSWKNMKNLHPSHSNTTTSIQYEVKEHKISASKHDSKELCTLHQKGTNQRSHTCIPYNFILRPGYLELSDKVTIFYI